MIDFEDEMEALDAMSETGTRILGDSIGHPPIQRGISMNFVASWDSGPGLIPNVGACWQEVDDEPWMPASIFFYLVQKRKVLFFCF